MQGLAALASVNQNRPNFLYLGRAGVWNPKRAQPRIYGGTDPLRRGGPLRSGVGGALTIRSVRHRLWVRRINYRAAPVGLPSSHQNARGLANAGFTQQCG